MTHTRAQIEVQAGLVRRGGPDRLADALTVEMLRAYAELQGKVAELRTWVKVENSDDDDSVSPPPFQMGMEDAYDRVLTKMKHLGLTGEGQ